MSEPYKGKHLLTKGYRGVESKTFTMKHCVWVMEQEADETNIPVGRKMVTSTNF
jgi:hypothetical protein